jgi:glycosyltransferase involved in cell wall biosynthesis
MTLISIIIPLHNEEEIVDDLITKLESVASTSSDKFEIILIDDGSLDDTWSKIINQSLNNNKIKGIKLTRNFGQHYAITAGVNSCSGDYAIVMDGDLQDRPAVIPDLISKAKNGFDVVFVSRKNRPESKTYLFFQKIFFQILKMFSGMNFNKDQANFSIMSRKVIEAFNNFPEYSRYYNSTIKWLGFKETFIDADHGTRDKGVPSYSLIKRIRLAVDIILSFSDRPLKITVVIGMAMSVSSILVGFFLTIKYILFGFTVEGWASLMVAMFIIGGTTISVLGVVGLYIGKIFDEVKRRPLYVVQERLNFDK